ncbi:MAG TPA: ATP-binding protein [Verrucomicrobiales bacterium]|nr:ATP-binding protein [Verrucomicrobiales bacterium]
MKQTKTEGAQGTALNTQSTQLTIQQEHDRMRERAAAYSKEMDGTGVVMAEAFVRGMRDIGYKNTAYALNEVIDNAIEARASQIHIELLIDPPRGEDCLKAVAIIDNGMGMPHEWVRHSIRWGATHRDQKNLTGMGRFGYGLKSSCISFARRMEVYSRIPGAAAWSMAYLDVDELANHAYRNENDEVGVPPPRECELPNWLKARLTERGIDLRHGTVIVSSKIDADRIRTHKHSSGCSDPDKFRSFLMEQFGITFRNYLGTVPIKLDGNSVQPIDPLFTTPGARYFDVDNDRAEALAPLVIQVKPKEKGGAVGFIRCRYSYMPPTFLRKEEHKIKVGADGLELRGNKNTNNERFGIRRENNGIIILRAGRQIDVSDSGCPWTRWQNNDRYIAVEIDFDPVLDKEFSVPTSKQQVVPSKRIWDILQDNGVEDAIAAMRKRFRADLAALDEKVSKATSPDQKAPEDPVMSPSEGAMKAAEKFIPPAEKTDTVEHVERAEENFRRRVKKEAEEKNVPEQKVAEALETQAKQRPYRVVLESCGALAPFFRALQEGGQRTLYINRDHRFYIDIYSKTDGFLRSGIETTLFSIGVHWIRSTGERRKFFESEMTLWSNTLNATLSGLEEYDGSYDASQVVREMNEPSATPTSDQAAA